MYAVLGVGLFVAALAVWFGMKSCEEPPPEVAAVVDAGPPAPPDRVVDDLIMPDDDPDTGPAPDAGGPRIRYVTRYVGGGGGNWNCSGDIDRAGAQRAIASHNLQFRNCYERRLKVNNQLEGRIRVQMRVGRTGNVTGVQTGGSLRDAQVLSCVRNIAQRIRFPAVSGRCAVIETPFNFTPQR